MSKEEISNDQIQGDYPEEEIPEIHSSEPSASDIEKFKRLYLPKSQANFKPSEESIESVNNLDYSKPNTLL